MAKKYKLFDINAITDAATLLAYGKQLEDDIDKHFEPLWQMLDKALISFDYATLFFQMSQTSSYRRRLANCYALASALRKRASGSTFLMPMQKGVVSVLDREAYQDELEAPFEGLKVLCEEQLRSLDMRVNECKKLMGIEGDGQNYANSRKQQAA